MHYFSRPPEMDWGLLRAARVGWPRPSMVDAEIDATPRQRGLMRGLGVRTVGDLLTYLPFRYEDHRSVAPIARVVSGAETGQVTMIGTLARVKMRPTRNPKVRIIEGLLRDASCGDRVGGVTVVWFNQPWMMKQLRVGEWFMVIGAVGGDRRVEVRAKETVPRSGPPSTLSPIYPASEAISTGSISMLVDRHLPRLRHLVDPVPARYLVQRRYPSKADAIASIHAPDRPEHAEEAQRRLAWEELLVWEIGQALLQAENRRKRAVIVPTDQPEYDDWVRSLPWPMTGDQARTVAEIDQDLASGKPMSRLVMGDVGSGKALTLDSLILTPSGFVAMEEVRVGERVINPTGQPSVVTGVFPQGVRDVWRVTFTDDTFVDCDAEHLWQVQTSSLRSSGQNPKILPTAQIKDSLMERDGVPKWHVEPSPARHFDGGGERPLDPYLLGLLLGNGDMSGGHDLGFTGADSWIIDAARTLLPETCQIQRRAGRNYDWNITGIPAQNLFDVTRLCPGSSEEAIRDAYIAGHGMKRIAQRTGRSINAVDRLITAAGVRCRGRQPCNAVVAALQSMGLMETTARTKFVPPAYLSAPISVRHAVLQGLLDTNGDINTTNGCKVELVSASQKLAEHAAWLARSLGGQSRCFLQEEDQRYWCSSMMLPNEFAPFRLPRKAQLVQAQTKCARPAKAIRSVDYKGREQVQCISVSHANGLFITNDFTITHNTVTAASPMLRLALAGYQSVMLAPTETLAEQHYKTLQSLLPVNRQPTLLTGGLTTKQRREAMSAIESGSAGIVVGTHAVLGDVPYRSLALAVIDEQHRFGVAQRAELALDRDPQPHVLHLSATPIPRSLALTVYGDLDVSQLRERPGARPMPSTRLASSPTEQARVWEEANQTIRRGEQAFVVCPSIAENPQIEIAAVVSEYERLSEILEGETVMLHGGMTSAAKREVMTRFAAGEASTMVATTVIEVGVDVPNATLMVIENAERFGIAQLHQLRGRVGRGDKPGRCVLFGAKSNARLSSVAGSTDGFALAESDLQQRGFGDLLGTRQHGLAGFRIARLPDDEELLEDAHAVALEIIEADPLLADAEHGWLRDEWERSFGEVG